MESGGRKTMNYLFTFLIKGIYCYQSNKFIVVFLWKNILYLGIMKI